MKSVFKIFWLTLLLFYFNQEIYGRGLNLPGGRGLIHLSSAWNLEKGGMTLHGYTSSYFEKASITRSNGITVENTYWDIQGALTFHFATSKHIEWVITQIVFQDNHKGEKENEFNAPDDLILKIKVGSLGSIASRFKFGLTFGTRIPIGSKHNLILEPYSSDRIQAGFITQISYSPDLLIPESAFNLHLNLGLWYHYDTGRFLANGPPEDIITVVDPTLEFLYGIGFAFPTNQFDFSLELTGQAFLNRPPVTAYGREDFIYLTPGIKYRLSPWISLLAGWDIRLSNFKDTTLYQSDGTALNRVNDQLANYPFWRFRIGSQINLRKPAPRLPTSINSSNIGTSEEKNSTDNKNVNIEELLAKYHKLTKEKLMSESAEEELARIRKESKRIQAIINRLRKILDIDNKDVEFEDEYITNKKPLH
ncbi:MAG: hypothetical protein ACE5JB_01600 [bacterium]